MKGEASPPGSLLPIQWNRSERRSSCLNALCPKCEGRISAIIG